MAKFAEKIAATKPQLLGATPVGYNVLYPDYNCLTVTNRKTDIKFLKNPSTNEVIVEITYCSMSSPGFGSRETRKYNLEDIPRNQEKKVKKIYMYYKRIFEQKED